MLQIHKDCKTIPCPNCHDHFLKLRTKINNIEISHHFKRDIKNPKKMQKVVNKILNESNKTDLHKFEEHIGNASVFRAKIDSVHYVFAIRDNKMIFLRAFNNFKKYKKFLSEKIEDML